MCYVYIAHIVEDYYKIGWSSRPKQRVNRLGLSVKNIVHLIETISPLEAEAAIHKFFEAQYMSCLHLPDAVFEHLRTGTGEVFKLNESDIQLLKTIPQLNKSRPSRDSNYSKKVVSL